jgi:hypothetical protein
MIKKEYFILVLSQIEKQLNKDRKLVKFLTDNNYIDGNPASSFSEPLLDITIKLLSLYFEDDAFNSKYSDTWIDWFIFDNDFGKRKLPCYMNKKEYIISNADEMYNFLILWKGNSDGK